jgi:hypothetical protein
MFSQAATDLIADVNGFFPAGSSFTSLVPGRLLESRGGLATVDGLFNGIGVRGAQSVTAVTVAGSWWGGWGCGGGGVERDGD